MLKINRNYLFCLLCLVLLCACSSGPGNQVKPQQNKAKNTGMALYQQQDYFTAIDYLVEAFNTLPQDQQVYVALMDSWFQLGETTRVWMLLNQSDIRTVETHVMEAELLAQQDACEAALIKSDVIEELPNDEQWLIRYWQVKGNCFVQTKQYLNAAKAYIQLSILKEDSMEWQSINDQIVQNLIAVDETTLIMSIGGLDDALTQGWIEAAFIKFGADGVSGSGWLQQWPDHPAAFYFLDLNKVEQQQRVAVLLPFSGRFEPVAKAVQSGMLAAALSDQNGGDELLFFDTGSAGENISNSWFQAQEYQADIIIGPLDKKSIEALSGLPEPTVPVVLLNQSDAPYLQFTLSPEGEAEAVAKRMLEDGQTRVLIMAPNDEWGERMTRAFAQRFVEMGGQIKDNTYFQPEQNDYSAQLRQALGLVESQLRAKNLQQFLKLKVNAEEVVRSDVDAIFLAARPDFARLMIPQLKFHRAAQMPVYSSSHVFDGLLNEQHNKDLDGVKFAISPIELQPDYLFETLPFDLTHVKKDKKLFALGYDAYLLIGRLAWMSRVNTGLIDGLTGTVSLKNNQKFSRDLLWAQYRNGSIVPLVP